MTWVIKKNVKGKTNTTKNVSVFFLNWTKINALTIRGKH